MSYPQDHLAQRTPVYQAIEEVRNYNDAYPNPVYKDNGLEASTSYSREVNSTNVSQNSGYQRRARPLGVSAQNNNMQSSPRFAEARISNVEGGIYQDEEPILTRNAPLNTRDSQPIYIQDYSGTRNEIPTRTATKTERMVQQGQVQPVMTSSVVNSNYEQAMPTNVHVIQGSERVLDSYDHLSPVVLSSVPITGITSSYPQVQVQREQVINNQRIIDESGPISPIVRSSVPMTPISVFDQSPVQTYNEQQVTVSSVPVNATSVIHQAPAQVYTEQQVSSMPINTTSVVNQTSLEQPGASQVTRITREEEIVRSDQPPSGTIIQQTRISLPYVQEFETGVAQPHFDNLSEIRGSEHLRDSVKIERSSYQIQQQTHLESQIADLSQMRHENHQTFENWEANRNLFVNDRLNITEDLVGGMDRTLDWLNVAMTKVILFFKERESQELEYSKTVKHGLTQVGEHFESSDHPELMNNFSRVLKENDAFHAQDKRNSEILGMFIRKDILDWILIPSEKEHKLQIEALMAPLRAQKRKMNHASSKRQRAYNKYFKLYDSIGKQGKNTNKEDSMFKRQLKYSLAAREELRMLRLYNQQALSTVAEFERIAPLRLAEVQKAYSLYLQKYNELYKNSIMTPDPLLQLINQTNGPDAIHSFFTVKNMVSPTNYQYLIKTLRIYNREVMFTDLNEFLVNFPDSVDPARSSFVVREWEAVRQGNLLRKSKACTVVATANNNIIIIEKKSEEAETGRVKTPMQMRFTRVEEIDALEDGTVLRVVERTPGTLFTHKHKTKLKFETPEEAQQFMQFVNSQPTAEV